MIHLIGQHWEGDVLVRWLGDDVTKMVVVEHWQDPQRTLDMVAAANSEGVATADGMGKPLVEVPVVLGMKYARERGIDPAKFFYSPEYAGEYKRFAAEHSKLAYRNTRSLHAVS